MEPAARATLAAAALLSASLVCGCAAGSASSPEDPEPRPSRSAADHERRGDLLVGEGNLAQASLEYRAALRLEPDRSPVRFKSGRLALRRGWLAEAEADFRTLLESQPDSAAARLGLGHAAFLAGKSEAEGLLRDALDRDAGLWQAHNLLGLLHERAGAPDRAAIEFSNALAINPGECSVANNLGVSLLRAGRLEDAVLAFERSRETGCTDPKVFNNLGLALARLDRGEDAFNAFLKVGTPATSWNNLGFIYLMEGNAEAAIAALERAAACDPAYNERAAVNLQRARAARHSSPQPQR